MATSLASQLQAIKSIHKGTPDPIRRPLTRPSVLFGPKEAADIDLRSILLIAISGLDALVEHDDRFGKYKDTIFSQTSLELDRGKMVKKEEDKLNLSICSYLRLLSGYFDLPASLKTLEYLIRRYEVHVFNMDELVLCALPYHDTHAFVRIVQLLDLGNKRWAFLEGVKTSGAPPPRKVIVQQCIRDKGILETLCDYAKPTSEFQHARPVICFCTAVIVESLGSVVELDSDTVKRVLPFVWNGLKPDMKGSRDHKAGALMVVGLLATRATLGPKLSQNLTVSIARVAKHDAEQSTDLPWIRVTIMAIISLVQSQSTQIFPKKTLDFLKEIRDFAGVLSGLSQEFNIQKFLCLYVETLVDYSTSDDSYLGALTEILETLHLQRDRDRIDAVLKILKKQAPLTMKQEKYCNDACVGRFLKGKGDNVKKAAKHLRAVLSWRESIGTDHLIADEFSSELAEGVAYVAGHDDEARPVMVFRMKQDYFKFHTQKSYLRLLVFTLEVAISSMSRFVDQFVLLFDASFFRSAPAFLNLYMGALKVISDFYPARLHRAFVIDPPSMFSCLWKGARPFVDLWAVTSLVSSLDYDHSLEDDGFGFGSSNPHRSTSLRFDSSSVKSNGGAGSTSSRFVFTVSHFDSLKPWYLSSVVPTTSNPARTLAAAPASSSSSPSFVGVSPLNARSFSFASPSARSTPRGTPRPQQTPQQQPKTPRPSFLQSPAMLFSGFSKKDGNVSRGEKGRETFLMYLRFYRRPYDEIVYRAKMRPPLGGLVSIVSPHGKQRRFNGVQMQHHHQRF